MLDYFKETKYVLNKIFFRYKSVSYRGRGIMFWKPDSGFQIEAPIERCDRIKGKIHFGIGGPLPRAAETISIRMHIDNCDIAISPKVTLKDELGLFINKMLSIKLNRIFLFQRNQKPLKDNQCFCGSGLYQFDGKPTLPQNLNKKTVIENKVIGSNSSRSAIEFRDPDKTFIRGHVINNDTVNLNWSCNSSKWDYRQGWKFAEAANYAFSILTGQSVQLLQRESQLGSIKRIEIRKPPTAKSLSFFKLFPNNIILNKNDFAKLTEFFAKDSREAKICQKIFRQIVVASQQQTLEGAELLTSTILEAILRTLYRTDWLKKHDREGYMHRFKEEYLSEEWTDICKRALTVFENLRHKNAHPIWLISETPFDSNGKIIESLKDIRFLCQFYGYVIMALAGYKDLKPVFID